MCQFFRCPMASTREDEIPTCENFNITDEMTIYLNRTSYDRPEFHLAKVICDLKGVLANSAYLYQYWGPRVLLAGTVISIIGSALLLFAVCSRRPRSNSLRYLRFIAVIELINAALTNTRYWFVHVGDAVYKEYALTIYATFIFEKFDQSVPFSVELLLLCMSIEKAVAFKYTDFISRSQQESTRLFGNDFLRAFFVFDPYDTCTGIRFRMQSLNGSISVHSWALPSGGCIYCLSCLVIFQNSLGTRHGSDYSLSLS